MTYNISLPGDGSKIEFPPGSWYCKTSTSLWNKEKPHPENQDGVYCKTTSSFSVPCSLCCPRSYPNKHDNLGKNCFACMRDK